MDSVKTKTPILHEQVQLLYAALPLSILATFINGSILVYIERTVIPTKALIIWFSCLSIAMLFRGIIYLLHKFEKPWSIHDGRWYNLNIVGVTLAALAWAGTSIFLYPSDSIAHQAFLGLVIAGMSAGAISTLTHSKPAITIFLSGLLLPLAAQFFLQATEFGIAMGSMVILYYVILSSTAIKTFNNSYQNIELRFKAEAQQVALKQSEEKYESIFHSAPLGILHYGLDGKITSFNPMALDLMETDDSTLLNTNLVSDLIDQNFVNAIYASLQGELGQYKGSTQALVTSSNKPIRMFCRGTYDINGDISGGVSILEDITEETRVDRLKNEFISTVSHELRTPLTAINGASSILLNMKSHLSEEQVDPLISNINRNSDRLLQLVNDILDVEKISTGKMDFKFNKAELSDLLNQSVSDNQMYAEKHQVKFVLEDCPENIALVVDNFRFQQVMANLLSNAAKFSEQNSHIKVGANKQKDNIRVFVRDTGPGIAPEFREKIFDKFTQHDSGDTRQVGGTGLGLTISKKIVEKMHGNLGFESEVGNGSTFYFDLPIAS